MSETLAGRVETGKRWLFVGVAGAFAVAVGLVLAVYFSARASDRTRAAEHARAVRTALAARRLDEARAAIDRWAALRPGDVEADYFRAELEVEGSDPQKALAAIRRAQQRGCPTRPLTVLSAVLQARAGQFEAAEPVLRRAFGSLSEPRAAIAEGLARIYLGTFRLPEAAGALDRWMENAPDDPRPYLWRNQIDERIASDPDVLIRNYRAALARDPSLAEAQLGLAEMLRKLHRVDEAATEYATLLGHDPKNLEGLLGAGQVALVRGDLAGATRRFNEALAIDPKHPIALRELAAIDLRNGHFAQARDRLKVAVEVAPDDAEVRYQYAHALKTAGDDARAAEETVVAARLRKDQQTIDDLRKALVRSPADASLRFEAAKWLIEHGHEKEGLEWTELILRQKPGHRQTCRFLAEYYTKKGNAGLANYYRLAASQ